MILITSALFGRMRVGRCLPVNHMIGCVADVTDLVKSRCDGKTSCAISLPDTQLHRRNTCPRHLTAYLEVDYRCVEGKSGSLYVDFLCRDNRLTFDITIAYRYERCNSVMYWPAVYIIISRPKYTLEMHHFFPKVLTRGKYDDLGSNFSPRDHDVKQGKISHTVVRNWHSILAVIYHYRIGRVRNAYMHIHVDAFLNTCVHTTYTVVYIVRCLVHNSHHKITTLTTACQKPFKHATLHGPGSLLRWNEVSTWTSKALEEVSYNSQFILLSSDQKLP